MTTEYDIAICGAGPVGLALAALLAQGGQAPGRILLVDGKPLEAALRDPRALALSYGSQQILEQLGAWPFPATAIRQIHVSRRGHFGRALIDRDEYGLPALGWVTHYGKVVEALAQRVEAAGITVLRPASVTALAEDANGVSLTLSDGRVLRAAIAVQAEGGVFSDQGARSQHRDYGQTALIAHVRVAAPQLDRAYERFTGEGPLALLPLDDGYSLVWCARPETIAGLQALPDAAFLAALGEAFGTRLGRFIATSPRAAFPLGLNAEPAATKRTVAIGNAAQTMHPVAGQGLNLGLRDTAVLARQLKGRSGNDALTALAGFNAVRAGDRRTTITLTDTLARVFASAPDGAPSQGMLGMALGLLDVVRPAKRMLAEHMMFGYRDSASGG